MYKGIYIALSGAVLQQKQLERISQNLANADTAGYKKDTLSFQDYLLPADAAGTQGRAMAAVSSESIDLSNGSIVHTGNQLDIALEGDGLIALEGNRYMRRGDLKKDHDGYLTAADGTRVLGNGGPIQLPDGEVSISEDGTVSVRETPADAMVQVDTIALRSFDDPAVLTKAGNGMFTAPEGAGRASTTFVRQGSLERSNVEVISEMVQMVSTLREFESYQKMIQAFDEATGKVNGEIARL